MRVRGPWAWAWTTLLAVSLSGCSLLHRRPSQAQAPPLKTGQGAIEQQQKEEHQPPPPSSLPQPTAQTEPPELPPVKAPKVKRKKKARQADSEPVPAQQTAAAPAAPASPIGQLTAGDSAAEEQTKQETIALIDGTEQGLGGIKRQLSSEEQTTALQIRVFLKQAKQALQSGDMDGAHTLATKAKLLLDELTKH